MDQMTRSSKKEHSKPTSCKLKGSSLRLPGMSIRPSVGCHPDESPGFTTWLVLVRNSVLKDRDNETCSISNVWWATLIGSFLTPQGVSETIHSMVQMKLVCFNRVSGLTHGTDVVFMHEQFWVQKCCMQKNSKIHSFNLIYTNIYRCMIITTHPT